MGRVAEEVGADELDLGRVAAAVLAEVDDDGVAVGQEVHGRDGRGPGLVGRIENAEIEVADIPGEPLHLAEAEIVPLGLPGAGARGPSRLLLARPAAA